MQKKLLGGIVAIAIITFGIFLVQSSTMNRSDSDVPSVSATIFPLYDIARTIGGEEIDVSLILPPGTSPHTFDPSPSAVRDLQQSSMVFAVGHTLDTWVEDLAAQGSDVEVVTVDDGITLLETFGDVHDDHEDEAEADTHDDHGHEEEGHDDHGHDDHENEDGHHDEEEGGDHHGHNHGPTDPHYWLDPRNAMLIANTIATELGELAPEHEALFEARAEEFSIELAEQMQEWKNELAPISGEEFVTLHDAFAYLADFATLDLVATFEPFPGREPTPQYLRELGEVIEEHTIGAIFSEPQLSTAGIESFAQDAGIEIGVLDPLGGLDDRESYIDLIDFNINALIIALQ